MWNDADIETAELVERAGMAAQGICAICEDALDPLAFEAKHPGAYGPNYSAAVAAACCGPVHPSLPYHVRCLETLEGGD